MKLGETTIEVNVKGLEALDTFLDKHGEKIQLVGSFVLNPGDTLVMRAMRDLDSDSVRAINADIKQNLPDIRAIVLDPCVDLLGVAKPEDVI